jgi:hypothetical protein
MDLQRVGTILTDTEPLDAMLCIDADLPHEVMVHWWGQQTPPAAALTQMTVSKDGNEFEFLPRLLFKTNENGGLILSTPKEAEDAQFLGYRMHLHREDSELAGEWTHSSGAKGAVKFAELRGLRSVRPETCDTWTAFKDWASRTRLEHDVVAYRGHGSNGFRLQTTLCRAGRNRLERYCAQTLQEFRSHAEALLGKRFDLNDPSDYSTVLGLAQHHGLPTPLLDWTGSPYVAAFFAFADAIEASQTRPNVSHVRVYGATREFLAISSPPVVTLPWFKPYVCSLAISPRDNPRLYAQQGQFMVTNFSDVEGLICALEAQHRKKFLVAADIPIGFTSQALEDLAFMGLTAGTMFPGLDGVGRMIRHAMIFKRPAPPLPGKPAAEVEGEHTDSTDSAK